MVIQGKNIDIGGGIGYLISTALKMALFQHQGIKKCAWVALEMSEEEYKSRLENILTKDTTNTT